MKHSVVFQIGIIFLVAFVGHTLSTNPEEADANDRAVSCGSAFQDRILAQIKLGMDPDIRPPPGDKATLVTINIEVVNIPVVDEENLRWTVTLYFREQWLDTRVAYGNLLGSCPNFEFLLITNVKTIESIWRPDTGIIDMLSGDTFVTPVPQMRLRFYPNGTVALSQYITATIYCNGKGSPPGQLMCPLVLSPYGNPLQNVDLAWAAQSPVQIDPDHIVIPNYVFNKVTTLVDTDVIITGSFAQLEADFYFTRVSRED